MLRKIIKSAFILIALSSCGDKLVTQQANENLVEENKFDFESSYIEPLGLTADGGKLTFESDAFILGTDYFPECSVPKGRTITFKSISADVNGYRKVILDES